MSSAFDPSSSLPHGDDDTVPPKLADGLADLYVSPRVPASVDSAILNAARAHFARQANRASAGGLRYGRLVRWVGAGAAAAAVAAVLLVAFRPGTPRSTPAPYASTLPGDVNGDGRVDILDAYLVARSLADKSRKTPLPATWDVNHDGVVDQKDVDWIANAAVRVGGGGAVADGSKTDGSADVFELANDLKTLGVDRGSKVALLCPSHDNAEKTDGLSRHPERSRRLLPSP